MFRSFFPEPRIFFPLSLAWMLFTTLIFQLAGDPVRQVISIDRYFTPAICGPTEVPASEFPLAGEAPAVTAPDPSGAAPAAGAAPAVPEGMTVADCVMEDVNFLNGPRIWEYWYLFLCAVIYCVFWYFYKRNEWYWWSVVGSTALFLAVYSQVQLSAFINDWQGGFFNVVQRALSEPGSVSPGEYWPYVIALMVVLLPNIIFLVFLAFFTSHYIFRWRKAMTAYYMAYWPSLRTTEGSAQRVQEDTMRFASIVEDLGTAFLGSLLTLVVFLPILWELSQAVTEVPIIGPIPGSLVWVALVVAAFGTALLWGVGIRLPGLNFENQKVEAALRKELVYGEDNTDRADAPTFRGVWANVQKNYFRLYFHYTYFNLARYAYLQVAGYVPLLTLSPSILAGTITLGLYQQVQNAFGEVASSFQFFARAWTVIVELISIYQRLQRFESFIPQDQPPQAESIEGVATI